MGGGRVLPGGPVGQKALTFLLVALVVTGCKDRGRIMSAVVASPPPVVDPPAATPFSNLYAIVSTETDVHTIDSFSDLEIVSRWVRAQLERPIAERRMLVSRVAPQSAGYYFQMMLLDSGTDARVAYCQRNALSLSEVYALYGIRTADVHYVDEVGTGLHQFTEYTFLGEKGLIDQYYGVIYLEGGRPVSKSRMEAQRRAIPEDTAYKAWVESVKVPYMNVPEQAHDVADDWVVGRFVY